MKEIGENWSALEESGKNGLENSKRKYEEAASTLKEVAEQISSLSIPESTTNNWKTLLSSIRIVDDRIDHIRDTGERLQLIEEIKGFLDGENISSIDDAQLEAALLNVRKLSEEMEENQRKFFRRQLSMILKVTENIKNQEDPREVVSLTALEGQLTSKLFLPFLPEEFLKSPQYPKLVHALSRLGRIGNSFDTMVDLSIDHENEQIKIEPTILNKVLFLGAVLSDGIALIKDTNLTKALLKEFLKGTKDTISGDSEK